MMEQGHSIAWQVLRPTVVIAGSGIWTEVLSRLVFRSGGSPIVVTRPDDLFGEKLYLRPSAMIVGAPLSPAELVRITALVRDRAPTTPLMIALDDDSPEDLAGDLAVLGAVTMSVDEDFRPLTNWVGHVTGLHMRDSHRGILLAPVLLRSGHNLHAAIASDVSEGGLGIEGADPALIGDVAEAQFHLPGMSAPITVAAEVAWVSEAGGTRVRAGVRFVDLDPVDRAAIRTYHRQATDALGDESSEIIALPF